MNTDEQSGADAPYRDAQRERLMADLKQVVERVPEQTEFTNSRVYKVWGPVVILGLLALLLVTRSMDLPVLLINVALLLATIWVTWCHRKAGTQVFMRLTRRQLFADTLSGPVDLTQVEHIMVEKEAMMMLSQTLEMHSGAPLPTHRVLHMQPFASQALAEHDPVPQIRIVSAGIAVGGRALGSDEVAALLGAYREAALALQQLDALQANG